MSIKLKNKTICGYHLLMILSVVDREIHPKEDMIIRDFLIEEYPPPIPINLDIEMEVISQLNPADYHSHFDKMLLMFQKESTKIEQLKLAEFAIALIHADRKITIEENAFIRLMIKTWHLAIE